MRKFILISMFIAGSLVGFSQSFNLESFLNKTTNKYKQLSNFQVTVKINITNVESQMNENRTGKLQVAGDKYKLSLPGTMLLSDGTIQWTYIEDAQEVNITENNQEEGQNYNIAGFLSEYKKYYTSKYIAPKTVAGKACYVIDFIPKTTNEQYEKVSMSIDKQSNWVRELIYVGTDETLYTISINNYVFNSNNITASTFIFDENQYPDAEVIDLR